VTAPEETPTRAGRWKEETKAARGDGARPRKRECERQRTVVTSAQVALAPRLVTMISSYHRSSRRSFDEHIQCTECSTPEEYIHVLYCRELRVVASPLASIPDWLRATITKKPPPQLPQHEEEAARRTFPTSQ